jgi:hypothetical protein
MVHAATATHRPKTARRKVTIIVGDLLQYKKYLLFIATKPDEVRREDKVGRRSIKQQYFLKWGQKIFSALKILKLLPLLLTVEVCLKEGKALGSIEGNLL